MVVYQGVVSLTFKQWPEIQANDPSVRRIYTQTYIYTLRQNCRDKSPVCLVYQTVYRSWYVKTTNYHPMSHMHNNDLHLE